MKMCPNCQIKGNYELCPVCGAKMEKKQRIPKGPIVRLILFAILLAVSVIVTLCSTPDLMKEGGFWKGLSHSIAVLGLTFFTSSLIMGWVKWCVFILPKSFRVANQISRHLVALSILGLAIKLMLWLSALLFPVGIGGSVLSSLISSMCAFVLSGNFNIVSAILLLFVSLLSVAAYALLELRSYNGFDVKAFIKNIKK